MTCTSATCENKIYDSIFLVFIFGHFSFFHSPEEKLCFLPINIFHFHTWELFLAQLFVIPLPGKGLPSIRCWDPKDSSLAKWRGKLWCHCLYKKNQTANEDGRIVKRRGSVDIEVEAKEGEIKEKVWVLCPMLFKVFSVIGLKGKKLRDITRLQWKYLYSLQAVKYNFNRSFLKAHKNKQQQPEIPYIFCLVGSICSSKPFLHHRPVYCNFRYIFCNILCSKRT